MRDCVCARGKAQTSRRRERARARACVCARAQIGGIAASVSSEARMKITKSGVSF
jgi:hypothetical protein